MRTAGRQHRGDGIQERLEREYNSPITARDSSDACMRLHAYSVRASVVKIS